MAGRGADWKVRLGIDGVANVITGFNSVLQLFDRAWDAVRKVSKETEAYTSVLNNHRVSVDEASAAVRQQVDVMDLHRAAARLEMAGLRLTENQMRAVTVAATQMADRTGTEVRPELERLTEALRGGTSEALRRYGIHLRESGTIAQRQQTAIEALTTRFGNQTVEVTSLDDAMTRLSNTWGHAWRSMASVIEQEMPGIMRLVNGLADVLDDVGNAMDTLARSRRSEADRAAAGDYDAIAQRARRELGDLGYRLDEGNRIVPIGPVQQVAGLFRGVGQGLGLRGQAERGEQLRATILEAERRMRENPNWAQQASEQIAAREAEREAAASDQDARDAQPGRARPWGLSQADSDYQRMLQQFEASLEQIDRRREDWMQQVREDEVEAAQEVKDRLTEIDDAKLEAVRDHAGVMHELAEAELADQERLAQQAEIENEKELERQQERRASIHQTGEVIRDLGSVFQNVTDWIVDAYGEQSAAAKMGNVVTGTVQAAYHGFMVGSDLADAASAFAKGPVGIPQGLAHIAAAIDHGIMAVRAVQELGGRGGSSGGGSKPRPVDQGAARPEYGVRQSTGEKLGGPSVVVEVHGVITSERAAQEIEAALRAQNRRRR